MLSRVPLATASILALLVFLPTTADAAFPGGNLLQNPSFESGTANWAVVSGTTTTLTYGSGGGPNVAVSMHIGGQGSYVRDLSGGAMIEQIVATGTIPAGTNVRVSGFFGGGDTDDSRLVVRFLNAANGEIARNELEYVTRQSRNLETVLMYREGTFQPPVGTVSVAARIEFRNNCCNVTQGAADLVSLELVAGSLTPPALPMNTELLVNRDFESGWAPGSPLTLTDAQGWEGIWSSVLVKAYSNVATDVPNASVSAVVGGNANLLSDSGGSGVLRQRLDVRGNTPNFSPSGSVALRVAAFQGGVGPNYDAARIDVQFLDANFIPVVPVVAVGPVSREERNAETVLLLNQQDLAVPPGTAYLDIYVVFINECCNVVQGLIDNVSAKLVAPTPPQPIPLGVNLVQNPGFESGSLPGSPLQLTNTGGWRGVNASTVEVPGYGSSTLVPNTAFADLSGLGGLVVGDLGGGAVLAQSFDLIGSAALVDGARLRIYLSCWLGGFLTDADSAQVQVSFVNALGSQVGTIKTIGPVTTAMRNSLTELRNLADDFPIPPQARRILLRLQFNDQCCNGAFGLADGANLVVYDALNPTTTGFCFGDGLGTPCPCANQSAVGANDGCRNSLGVGGRLRSTGTASIAADSLVLIGSQMPNSSVLYFQGSTQSAGGLGNAFGDGLRCATGTIIRLGIAANTNNASQYPTVGSPPVSVRGNVLNPGIRTYQAWYRNTTPFCTSSTFNLTNGWQVTWAF